MGRALKILESAKVNPAGLSFSEIQRLTEAAGCVLKRRRGSHHVYSRPDVVEIIDLQPVKGHAKSYQVRQVLALIEKYSITIE